MMQSGERSNDGNELKVNDVQTNLLQSHLEKREASRIEQEKSGWFGRLPPWLLVLLGLIAGVLIGVQIMRQRTHAQDVIVAVNGVIINKDAFFHRLQIADGVPTMHKMVEENLQIQFAKKKGLLPSKAQVDAEYAKLSQKPGFDQLLATSSQTVGDLKQSLRLQLAKSAVLTQGISVSDAEVQQYYQHQTDPKNSNAVFYQPQTITLRAIETPSKNEAAKAIAELAAQTPFELVVATYSQDPSKTNGGLLNPLLQGRSPLRSAPLLEKSVFNLKVGQQLGPVQFNNHWWIFLCVDKSGARTVPFDTVKDQCVLGAKIVKGGPQNNQKVEAEFTAFQHAANMQAFWPQYQAAIGSK